MSWDRVWSAVRGYPALNLDGAHVEVPTGLAPGDAVLVYSYSDYKKYEASNYGYRQSK